MAAATNPVSTGLAVGNLLTSVGLGFLTAHHQKAVQNEQQSLGANVPACRASFQKTMDSFSAGMIDSGTAVSRLQKAVDDFRSATSSIRKQSGKAGETGNPKAGGKCNAACVWSFTLQGEADDLKKQINAASGGNPSAKTNAGPGAPSITIQSGRAKDAAGNGLSQFSIGSSSLTGGNLALVVGGVLLFLLALVIAGARKRA